jgi:uncharacterized membrane protein YkvA (DUF1232 family)
MFEKLRSIAQGVRREIRVWQLVLKDPRTPKLSKILLWIALGYLLLPFDILPDFLPVVGHLDDVLIVSVLVIIALKMIPKEIVDDCRWRANSFPEN